MFDGKYSPAGDPWSWIPFPSLFGAHWFKSFASFFVERVQRATNWKPRVHALERYLIVVAYALLKRWSIHEASTRLNRQAIRWFKKRQDKWPKQFADARVRRYYPHQTSVNAFLARLPPEFVEETFSEFFLNQLVQACEDGLIPPAVTYMADNTRYAYYGDERDKFTLKYHKFMGTDHGRFYQGSLVLARDVALILRFSSLAIGESRVKRIKAEIEALQAAGIRIKRALFDREFYRVLLLRDLNALRVPVIIPAKQTKGVKRLYRHFLRQKRGMVQKYYMSQTARAYPAQKSVRLHAVIIGKNNQDPREVREGMLPGPAGERLAMKDLRAFFTTIPPWKVDRAFASFLCREYKKRWRIECAFRDVNKFSPNWRTNHRSTRLFYFGVSALLYNIWQLRAKTRGRGSNRHLPVTQNMVTDELTRELEKQNKALFREREQLWARHRWHAYDFGEKIYA